MSHRITCPHCSTPLRLPEGLAAAFATCPRCLGKLPNPGAPEGGAADDWNIRPMVAIEDEIGTDTRRTNRGLLFLTLLLFFGVFFGGGLSGLIGSTKRGWLGSVDTLANGMMITLALFAVLFLPVLLVWLTRTRFVKRAAPDGFGRVLLIVVFWILFSALAGAAAFVLFLLACYGGMYTGEVLR